MPYNDFLSGKRKEADPDKPEYEPINRGEERQLQESDRNGVPYNSRLKRNETPEETSMRAKRARAPKV